MADARPKWVRNLCAFISDGIVDESHGYPKNGSDDEVLDEIEAAVHKVLCRRYGHDLIDDHCGLPEHRYWNWCGKRVGQLGVKR